MGKKSTIHYSPSAGNPSKPWWEYDFFYIDRLRGLPWSTRLLILGSFVFVLFGVILIPFSIRDKRAIDHKIASWHVTQAKVVETGVSVRRRWNSPTRYDREIRYYYSVGDEHFINDRIYYGWGPRSWRSPDEVQAVLPVIGTSLKIYYDPENPQRSAINLFPTSFGELKGWIGFYALFAGGGALMIYLSLREKLRKRIPASGYDYENEITDEDRFFLDQIGRMRSDDDIVRATAYLRTNMNNSPWKLFSAAGHFLALTDSNLFVVKTTAPAFAKPILDNQGVERIPLDQILSVELEPRSLRVIHQQGSLDLEVAKEDRYFPAQSRFLELLAMRFEAAE